MRLLIPLALILSAAAFASENSQVKRLSADAYARSVDARREANYQVGYEFILPEFIVGGEWTSTIRFTNKGSVPIVDAEVLLIDNLGQPLFATFTTYPDNQLVTDSGFLVTLPDKGVLEVNFQGGGPTQYGYVWVDTTACPLEADCSLYAEVALKNSHPSRPDLESVFPLEEPASEQYFLWDHRGGFSTTLYLVSANLTPNDVELEFRDSDDNLIDIVYLSMYDETLILIPHARVPATLGKYGTLIIRATNMEDEVPLIVATALRINPTNSFTPMRAFVPKY